MRTFKTGAGNVFVNDTDVSVIRTVDVEERRQLENALSALTPPPSRVRRAQRYSTSHYLRPRQVETHVHHARFAVAAHRSGLLVLSPKVFTTSTETRFASPVIDIILAETDLGRSMMPRLESVDLFGFIKRLKTDASSVYTRRMLRPLLASLCMCIAGASSFDDLGPDVMQTWQNYFRTINGHRWRPELWPVAPNVAYQCLREISHAYGRATGHKQIATRAAQRRTTVDGRSYWFDVETGALPQIEPWLKLFQEWRSLAPTYSRQYRQMFLHVRNWLEKDHDANEVKDVLRFMCTARKGKSFADYLRNDGRKPGNKGWHKGNQSDSMYLSYANKFSEWIAEELSIADTGLPVYHLVTTTEVRRMSAIRGAGGSGRRHVEAVSRPLPTRYYNLARKVLEEGELGWPGTCRLCIVGLGAEEVYCPVLPALFLSLFHLPLRVGQMKRLDSGEGDVTRFDGAGLKWGVNKGPNAGYWKKIFHKPENRGYAFLFDSDPALTGFSINTNKTGNPYNIPWQNEELHRLFHDLRCWQERYNPIRGPIPPLLYIDGVDDSEAGKLDSYPDIFPLFRLPTDRRGASHGRPPNARRTGEFWYRLLAEVERRWNEENPQSTPVQLVKRSERNGQTQAAYYNPHGMRAAGLTTMLHRKVPIEIISKLIAGHRTVLMTLYYMKLDPASVHQALEAASQNAESVQVMEHMRDLKMLALEDAQRKSAHVGEDGLQAAVAMPPQDKILWADCGIGFCPYDGARCGDGGKLLKRDRRPSGLSYDAYSPVEGGPRNCIMCRHFVSGAAWRTPLWLYGNKLCRKLAVKSERIRELEEQLERLRSPNGTEADNRIERSAGRIDQVEVELAALREEQELVGKALWNTIRLLESCKQIDSLNADADRDQTRDVAIVEQTSGEVSFGEVSEFTQAALITAAGRVYPVLHDDEAEAARNRFLDAIIWHNGGQPLSMAKMDPADKKRSQDEMAALLLKRVEDDELEALVSGSITLQDLSLQGEVGALLTPTFGKPVRLVRKQSKLSNESVDK